MSRRPARPRVERQPLMPEAAANPGAAAPRRHQTQPAEARLWDGHLSAECSIRENGAPACPACLAAALNHATEQPDPGGAGLLR